MKIPAIWLGAENDLAELLFRTRLSAHAAELKIKAFADSGEDEIPYQEKLASDLIEIYGSVGVISVDGALVSEEDPFNPWVGVVGYPTIARALNQLLAEPEVKSIVLAINSPGGNAEGVGEAGDAIKAASQVKPVVAWTGSNMLSAGYWLGSSAQAVYGTKMARVGSIGAVTTFTSLSRMLKENGIDVEVVRSSPMKAMPHHSEPLTDKGRGKLQKEVDFFHSLFIDHVVQSRTNLSSVRASEGWASGESFFGEEASRLGLLDAPLKSLNALISELDSVHNSVSVYGGLDMPQRVVINASSAGTARAALSAGIPIDELDPELVAQTDESDPVDEPEEDDASEAPAEPVSAPAVAAGLDSGASSLIERLHAEATKAGVELALARQEISKLTSQLEEASTMRPALQKAVERLQVGLGHRPALLDKMPVGQLVEMYGTLYSELMALPVGRKSLSESEEEPQESPSGKFDSVVEQRLRIVPKSGRV